jgi:hypothetical protein
MPTLLTLPLTGRRSLVVAALAALTSSCATTQAARVVAEPPQPLMVPAAPPRIIVPTDPTPPPPPEEAPPPAAPTRPRPTRPAMPRTDPREVPKPADAPAEAAKPNGQEAAPTPAPTLEMQPGDRGGDAGVRQQLGKAGDDLQKVNYAMLSNDLKAQYDTAKRFITLGEQALREQNLIFAATLADKAAAIATLLLRR